MPNTSPPFVPSQVKRQREDDDFNEFLRPAPPAPTLCLDSPKKTLLGNHGKPTTGLSLIRTSAAHDVKDTAESYPASIEWVETGRTGHPSAIEKNWLVHLVECASMRSSHPLTSGHRWTFRMGGD